MAERLLEYYKYIGKELGMLGKMQLAQKTKLPALKAAMEVDTPEKIELFQNVIEELTGKPAPKL